MTTPFQMLPEWNNQSAVLLAWPHQSTDWSPWLKDIESSYIALVTAISQEVLPLILCQDAAHEQHILAQLGAACRIPPRLIIAPYNDTWCRDYGAITVGRGHEIKLLDFSFNGWGDKYSAQLDNQINQHLAALWRAPLETVDIELEGGSIESDGQGTLLTTEQCLLNPNRGATRTKTQLEAKLKEHLGADRILWLKEGGLVGDDTDSHIDNLARFADPYTIVYLSCNNPEDLHYAPLQAMAAEIKGLKQRNGEPYRTFAVELPPAINDPQNGRLPASYVNFLILNHSVIVPVFDQPTDAPALATLQQAFPEKSILAVPGQHLIKQFGGPHCATMQLPAGTLNL